MTATPPEASARRARVLRTAWLCAAFAVVAYGLFLWSAMR
jgi:Ca2+/H+ antiporter